MRPVVTLEEFRVSVGTLAEESGALAEDAPDEVVEDVQLMATYFAEWRDTAAAAMTREEVRNAGADLDSADEFRVAGQKLHGHHHGVL